MTKKSLIMWLLIVAILPTLGALYLGWGNEPTEAKKTEEEVFLEKWQEVGKYKYIEEKAKKNAQEELDKAEKAKQNKDKLLEELNGTGFTQ